MNSSISSIIICIVITSIAYITSSRIRLVIIIILWGSCIYIRMIVEMVNKCCNRARYRNITY